MQDKLPQKGTKWQTKTYDEFTCMGNPNPGAANGDRQKAYLRVVFRRVNGLVRQGECCGDPCLGAGKGLTGNGGKLNG